MIAADRQRQASCLHPFEFLVEDGLVCSRCGHDRRLPTDADKAFAAWKAVRDEGSVTAEALKSLYDLVWLPDGKARRSEELDREIAEWTAAVTSRAGEQR